MSFTIALRNVLRNRRRSLMTLLTIAIGAAALLVFAAYALYDVYVLQTTAVQRGGHLTVFRKGYSDFGTTDPAHWGIKDYPALIARLRADPVLNPMLTVVTPVQYLGGIAENPANGRSKTFFASGYVAADRMRMQAWDEYQVGGDSAGSPGLSGTDASAGVIGRGFAQMLGLCAPLHLKDCPRPPPDTVPQDSEVAGLAHHDFGALTQEAGSAPPGPGIDLLAATAGGAPNIVRMTIAHVERQGAKEMDDNYVAMHLKLAQALVYGRGTRAATGIVLQLKRSEDIAAARARLATILAGHRPALEVRDFRQINAYYGQTLNYFRALFGFIAIIIGVVVLFTVTNTMGMSMMERTAEIGTVRALGARRSRVRAQFLMEGALLGLFGASLGVGLAVAAAAAINHAGFTWVPPGDAHPIPLKLTMAGAAAAIVAVWIVLIAAATMAALLPANRAAKLEIVDALRHA